MQRREEIEQRHRLGLVGQRDAAVNQPNEPGAADRGDFDDGIAPEMIASAGGDNESAEDGGARAAGIQPADRAARQRLVAGATRQDRDLGALVVVLTDGPRIETPDYEAIAAIIGDGEKPPGARQFENAPAAVVKNRRSVGCRPAGGCPPRRHRGVPES